MKNEKATSKLNKGVLLVLVFAVLLGSLAGVAGIVFARYTNSQHAQRTIAPYDFGGARFSSNYLNGGESKDNIKVLYVSGEDVRPGAGVTVCNYQQENQLRVNDSNITYDLTIRLVRYNESTGRYDALSAADLTTYSLQAYSVEIKKFGDANTYTLGYNSGSALVEKVYENYTLIADVAQSDSFSIKFSAKDGENTDGCFALNTPNLYVEMEAEAKTGGSLPTLRGIFKVGGIKSEGTTNSWEGMFADSHTYLPNDYDGFNYTVSGVGQGRFTLKWDSTKVALRDDTLLSLLAIPGVSQSGSTISFPVNSDDVSRYDLHFYKVNVSGVSWENMEENLTEENADKTPQQRGKAVVCYFSAS